MNALSNALEQLQRLGEWIARPLRWLVLLMVITTVVVVLLRYAFDTGAIFLQELVMYLHGLFFTLALAFGIAQDTHVRVDILYSRQPARRQHIINLVGHCVFLLPVATLVFITSLPYVSASWRVLEGSSEVGGIPAVFLLKSLLPICAVLLIVQALASCARLVRQLLELDL
ncbi:MAG: permease [Gammaproteobacteria bacterium]|nr:permease [Gammaproteobacteria bacterium]|tara:strand:- start:7026 stop:7538 length:513 start_codon:yes stop_codon:yes gene_type:complete